MRIKLLKSLIKKTCSFHKYSFKKNKNNKEKEKIKKFKK